MSALAFTRSVIGCKLEQRFGLLGLARLLKLAELVVARAEPGAKRPRAVVAWGDFKAALQFTSQEAATEFLNYCDHARVLDQGVEGDRLRLTLAGELVELIAPPAPPSPVAARQLFQSEQEWAEWFSTDLNCPPYLRNDPATRRLFRHWCASNVTVDEVEAAAIRATSAREAPHPATLHDYIKAMRLEKIRAAS